jgi:hypothetical protein
MGITMISSSCRLALRRPARLLCAAALALAAAGCTPPDPKAELAIEGLETYWAIDSPAGGTQFLAPVVRFTVRNQGSRARRSIMASATYRREGETVAWSSAFWKVAPVKDESLAAGASGLAVLKPEGEGRYTSTGPPEAMFGHPAWKDVSAEIFMRVDNSNLVSFGTFPIERRIGSKGLAP